MSELPEGWAETTLGSVVESMKNGLYKPVNAYTDDGVACLRMYNIDEGKIVWKGIKRMKLSSDEVEAYQLLPGDILVNRVNSRELVGKAAVIPQGLGKCVFESKNIRVRFHRDAICPELANYALFLGGQRHFTQNAQQVVGMASISQPQVAAFPLNLPPLNEQRRIVAKLEKLLSRVDAAQARLATIPRILKRFRQSVLAAACSGKLTADWREANPEAGSSSQLIKHIDQRRNSKTSVEVLVANECPDEDLPSTWTWVRFGSVIGELRNGVSIPPNTEPPGTPMLRINAARPGKVDLDEIRYLPNGENFSPQYCLQERDLLFTRYNGSLDLLGVCGMVRELNGNILLYPDKLMRVRFDHELLLPEYVEVFFQAPTVHERVIAKSKSSAGQNGVSGSDIKSQAFALPPLTEQQEIVRRVEALFKTADALEARYRTAKAHVDKLTQSILARAFRGELVMPEAELARQEGRDYEPASRLLERIRQERATTQQKFRQPKTIRTRKAKQDVATEDMFA